MVAKLILKKKKKGGGFIILPNVKSYYKARDSRQCVIGTRKDKCRSKLIDEWIYFQQRNQSNSKEIKVFFSFSFFFSKRSGNLDIYVGKSKYHLLLILQTKLNLKCLIYPK